MRAMRRARRKVLTEKIRPYYVCCRRRLPEAGRHQQQAHRGGAAGGEPIRSHPAGGSCSCWSPSESWSPPWRFGLCAAPTATLRQVGHRTPGRLAPGGRRGRTGSVRQPVAGARDFGAGRHARRDFFLHHGDHGDHPPQCGEYAHGVGPDDGDRAPRGRCQPQSGRDGPIHERNQYLQREDLQDHSRDRRNRLSDQYPGA